MKHVTTESADTIYANTSAYPRLKARLNFGKRVANATFLFSYSIFTQGASHGIKKINGLDLYMLLSQPVRK